MLDLYLLVADMKNERSQLRRETAALVGEMDALLRDPSDKTAGLLGGWLEDFRYLYGDGRAGLAGNSRLDGKALLARYGVAAEEDEQTALRRLFFAIQTCFSLLIKCVTRELLRDVREEEHVTPRELILGDFARRYGIENYGGPDWYCWPAFELKRGFAPLLDRIEGWVARYRTDGAAGEEPFDFIKQMYEAVIPKEFRHALGEYYTPDWLAEATLRRTVELAGADPRTAAVLDPTCGSGTFLVRAIAWKRREGCGLREILATVRGVDVNPLAALTAKTIYLLSVLDLLDGVGPVTIPVYNGDIVDLDGWEPSPAPADFFRARRPADAALARRAADRAAVARLAPAELVVGNPPWVNWEYLPASYRQRTGHLWLDYGLFSARGRDLSFSKEDVSVLITAVVAHRLLAAGGVMGFVIRQGVFKSARNGAGFRRFRGKDGPWKVLRVDDLSRLRAFENAANSAALLFLRKGEETVYPVPYCLWEKRPDVKRCSFGPYSPLREVMSQVTVTRQQATPADRSDPASPWLTGAGDRLDALTGVLGTNRYRARTGVFTGGANGVYWLKIHGKKGKLVSVTNVTERAKRKAPAVRAELEPACIYPMVRGSNVGMWRAEYDTYLLCPHTAETRLRPIPQEELERTAPRTMVYLERFRAELDGRKGFAGWEKEIQREFFHAVLRVGDYTFSPWKVVWKYIATEFVCAVIGGADDPWLGKKLILPNEKLMYVSTDDEGEAYYLCGVLSSTPVAQCVKSYMNPTSISAHVLGKLRIPDYDPEDPVHAAIAALCREGHGKTDIGPYREKIDTLAKRLYEA